MQARVAALNAVRPLVRNEFVQGVAAYAEQLDATIERYGVTHIINLRRFHIFLSRPTEARRARHCGVAQG